MMPGKSAFLQNKVKFQKTLLKSLSELDLQIIKNLKTAHFRWYFTGAFFGVISSSRSDSPGSGGLG
jgi:hypothetical protein